MLWNDHYRQAGPLGVTVQSGSSAASISLWGETHSVGLCVTHSDSRYLVQCDPVTLLCVTLTLFVFDEIAVLVQWLWSHTQGWVSLGSAPGWPHAVPWHLCISVYSSVNWGPRKSLSQRIQCVTQKWLCSISNYFIHSCLRVICPPTEYCSAIKVVI